MLVFSVLLFPLALIGWASLPLPTADANPAYQSRWSRLAILVHPDSLVIKKKTFAQIVQTSILGFFGLSFLPWDLIKFLFLLFIVHVTHLVKISSKHIRYATNLNHYHLNKWINSNNNFVTGVFFFSTSGILAEICKLILFHSVIYLNPPFLTYQWNNISLQFFVKYTI